MAEAVRGDERKRAVFHTLSHYSESKKVRLAPPLQHRRSGKQTRLMREKARLHGKEGSFALQTRLVCNAKRTCLLCKTNCFASPRNTFFIQRSLVCTAKRAILHPFALHTVHSRQCNGVTDNALTTARAILPQNRRRRKTNGFMAKQRVKKCDRMQTNE